MVCLCHESVHAHNHAICNVRQTCGLGGVECGWTAPSPPLQRPSTALWVYLASRYSAPPALPPPAAGGLPAMMQLAPLPKEPAAQTCSTPPTHGNPWTGDPGIGRKKQLLTNGPSRGDFILQEYVVRETDISPLGAPQFHVLIGLVLFPDSYT